MASWITLDKSSGGSTSGATQTSVKVTCATHTGRAGRSGTLVVRTSKGVTKSVSVNQNGVGVKIEANNSGGTIEYSVKEFTFDFTTNCKSFTLSVGNGTISQVTANGTVVSPVNGTYTPSGDPGSTSPYNLKIKVTFPANETADTKTISVVVTDKETPSYNKTSTLSQKGFTFVVSPTSINHGANQSTTEVTITASGSWSISNSNSNITISPKSGTGNGKVTVTTAQNGGVDYTDTINVVSGSVTKKITVNKTGLREVFTVKQASGSAWEDFITSDSGEFLTLK